MLKTRTMNNTAVVYARVSSKDQEREGFSIPAQLDLLRSYAAGRGLRIVREFVDVETAKQAGPAAFGDMVSFARQAPRAPRDPRGED
jgi:DNA invertase Pin-like site-specific DNA recombinase